MAHLAPLLLAGAAVFVVAKASRPRRRKKPTQKNGVVTNGEKEKTKELPDGREVVSNWYHRQEALKALSDLGICECDPGDIDGKYGTQTATAVRNFQDHVGLPETGHWDEHAEREMLLLLRSLQDEKEVDFPEGNGANGKGEEWGPDDILVPDPECNYMRHIADEFFEIQRRRAAEYALEGNTMGEDALAIHQEMVEEYMPLCASLGREGVGPGVREWWNQNVSHVAGILSEYQHSPDSLEEDAEKYGLV